MKISIIGLALVSRGLAQSYTSGLNSCTVRSLRDPNFSRILTESFADDLRKPGCLRIPVWLK
jgi:hypothetical protein